MYNLIAPRYALMLLYIPSCSYIYPHALTYVLTLLCVPSCSYICPHAPICTLALLYAERTRELIRKETVSDANDGTDSAGIDAWIEHAWRGEMNLRLNASFVR